jgi:hypothetical protein
MSDATEYARTASLVRRHVCVVTRLTRIPSRIPARYRSNSKNHDWAEHPGIGAITTARALATRYAALLGPVNGVRLVEDLTLSLVTQPHRQCRDNHRSGTAGPDIRFAGSVALIGSGGSGNGTASGQVSEAGGEFSEGDADTIMWRHVNGEFVVAASKVLDERVPSRHGAQGAD